MSANGVGTGAPGIEVQDLTVTRAGGEVPVVAGVSFAIASGETMGLVGESGSGKSTVALAMLAHARPGLQIAAGAIRVGGTDMLSLDKAAVVQARGRIVSYVPQDPASSLNPAHRVGTQLREVLEIHQDAIGAVDIDQRLDELLEEVALPRTVLDRFPHQMSGGQQQRVVIAAAFACRPPLVVLDEPTTGLDVSTQRRILDTIRELSERHSVSCLYVSHDLAAVGQIASTTAVIYAGRIIESGETQSLYTEPSHPYTAGLLAAAPSPRRSARLVGITGRPPSPGRWPKGCGFANRCERADDRCQAEVPALEDLGHGRKLRCVHPLPPEALAKLAGDPIPVPTARSGLGLEVSRVSAHYGGPPILRDVSLSLEPGLCAAVVGESGSGKTTLARCVCGLHDRWTGEIRLGDVALATAAPKRTDGHRRAMQYIFQNPFASLNPTMTVGENIEEPLRHFERLRERDRRARVLEALSTVALSDEFVDRLPNRLSGGERQRVAVARALVVNPEVLVCDEITSALDVSVQAVLVEQLRELQLQRGLTILFITHNLAVVRSLAQNVIVLQHGEVVERGPTETVLDNPQHEYTQQLLRDIPDLTTATVPAHGGRFITDAPGTAA